MERVRQYQINRLKYYYAIVEFDSVASANRFGGEVFGSCRIFDDLATTGDQPSSNREIVYPCQMSIMAALYQKHEMVQHNFSGIAFVFFKQVLR